MVHGLAYLLICMTPDSLVEVSWSELPHLVAGRTVAVERHGSTIQGRVAKVEDQGIVIQVKKARVTIPRFSITELRVASDGRRVGTTLGVLAGFFGGMEMAEMRAKRTGAQVAVLSAMLTGSALAGYRLGARAVQWRTVRILNARPGAIEKRENDER